MGTKGVESANGLSDVQVYATTKGAEFKQGKFPWEKGQKADLIIRLPDKSTFNPKLSSLTRIFWRFRFSPSDGTAMKVSKPNLHAIIMKLII